MSADMAPQAAARFQVVYLQRDLVGCPRCAGVHPGLGYRRFTRVADPAAARFPFWALCPATGEPLLLAADQAPSPASIFAALLAGSIPAPVLTETRKD